MRWHERQRPSVANAMSAAVGREMGRGIATRITDAVVGGLRDSSERLVSEERAKLLLWREEQNPSTFPKRALALSEHLP